MSTDEALAVLDEVIPHPTNKMVDSEHMKIAVAWLGVKEELKAYRLLGSVEEQIHCMQMYNLAKQRGYIDD